MQGDKELTDRVAELEAKAADMEATLESYNEALIIIGRWLKALANNDTVVLTAVANARSSGKHDEARELVDQVFKFREEIEEKINTDEQP